MTQILHRIAALCRRTLYLPHHKSLIWSERHLRLRPNHLHPQISSISSKAACTPPSDLSNHTANMKLAILSLLVALLAISVLGKPHQRAVIVSYPEDTPDSVLTEAKDALRKSGGIITHEYSWSIPYLACAVANPTRRTYKSFRRQSWQASSRTSSNIRTEIQCPHRG